MLNFVHGEVNVTLACMNHCVSCNHFIPLQKLWYADPAVIEHDLNLAAKLMHFETFNMVGGEPTLHPLILSIASIIRTSGICERIQLSTNGQTAEYWPDELYDVIDDLQITPYKLTQSEKDYITAKCKGKRAKIEWHFVGFTYAAYKKPRSPKETENLYRLCWYRANRQVIDEGYFYSCCIGSFITKTLLGLPRQNDGIALEGLTEEKLQMFLSGIDPPAACYICGSNSAPFIGWHEQPDMNKWLNESLG